MITAIIQARMSSSRLPGKVLLDIAGQPMLVRMVERARRARSIEQVVVATTTVPSDDPIEKLCAVAGYACFRGGACRMCLTATSRLRGSLMRIRLCA